MLVSLEVFGRVFPAFFRTFPAFSRVFPAFSRVFPAFSLGVWFFGVWGSALGLVGFFHDCWAFPAFSRVFSGILDHFGIGVGLEVEFRCFLWWLV